LFATGVNDTNGKFAASVIDTSGKFAAGIVDTGGKFATGISNTCGTGDKICHNLPPVSLISVVHLDLQISPQIFEQILNDPGVIFRGLGKDNS
jgi:hypothetical protein